MLQEASYTNSGKESPYSNIAEFQQPNLLNTCLNIDLIGTIYPFEDQVYRTSTVDIYKIYISILG